MLTFGVKLTSQLTRHTLFKMYQTINQNKIAKGLLTPILSGDEIIIFYMIQEITHTCILFQEMTTAYDGGKTTRVPLESVYVLVYKV